MKNNHFQRLLAVILFISTGWVQGQVNVTFRVNMANQTVSANGVHLAGSIQGWNASSTPMTDADSDGIYEVPYRGCEYLLSIQIHQWRFLQ